MYIYIYTPIISTLLFIPISLSPSERRSVYFQWVFSKGLSLSQWMFTGTVQRTFSGTFQGKLTSVISGV